MIKFTLTAIFAFTLTLFLSGQSAIWNDIPDPKRETQQIYPETYRTMTVDFESLKAMLLAAPKEGTDLRNSDYTVILPSPDGSRAAFKIVEESVMDPALQARYPDIRTYVGAGKGDYAKATINLDFTLKGFHAQILLEGKTYYIDPLSPGDLNTYIVYSRESFFKSNTKQMHSCEAENIGAPQPDDNSPGQNSGEPVEIEFPLISNGTELRTYSLALACTGEYAQFHGGTKPLVLSAMTTTMNRVNGIFRKDVCLRMLLISNNDDIIFLNAGTDGYSNTDGGAMLTENQVKTDFLIGSANYDIGHVFSTGPGGIAYLGVVCDNSYKAGGVTGLTNPIGDPFDVDYVSHELGHQWNASHTFNNTCSGNRETSSAYEPGSGSTIMSYAGICSPNLQFQKDAHFHNHSFNQMVAYSVGGAGNTCATITSAVNTPPVVSVPTSGFSIPKSTPFELTASATDANNDPMTYCWEQYDLGPATTASDNNLTSPSGTAPILRSWPPTSNSTRVFPRITDLVNNTTVLGELLPTYSRNMNFRCTVRDNYTNGAVTDAQVSFAVSASSGPFLVTSPNNSITWDIGENATVTWNVANTTAAPVSCSNVNIYLSTDGGLTYPTLLISNTPNDGSQSVVVPNLPTGQARIKVKAVGNIFFDISNANFNISIGGPPANDEVCNAITINCGDNLAGTNVNATPSTLGQPSCDSGSDDDVFYKFNATEGSTYTITVNGANYDGVLAIYSGASCGSTLTELACADNGLTSGVIETITFTAVENTPIFIQTHDWSSSNGEFIITLDCEFANDDPCDAPTLTCGETVSGSNTGATQSTLGLPSCTNGSQNDVFYKIEAIAGVDYTVTVNGANYDGVLAAYTGSCSGTLTELDCSDVGIGVNLIETINFSVASNQTVYIQTYDWFSSGGEFLLTVACSNVPYDDPCDALTLYCGESFSGSSAGATLSSLGNTSCALGSLKDVFFNFSALADVEYSVVLNGENYDGVIAAYTGSCSGTLTQIECADNGFNDGIAETIYISVETDQDVLIRIYDYAASGPADFTITLNCPIPDNDDCGDAISLTVNNPGSCPANQVAGTTYGSNSSSPDGCEADSPDVYYTFNSGNNSEVIINLDAISAGDLVLSVFESSCGSEAFFCQIGTNQSPQILVTPFTTYFVRVHSFSSFYTGSFNICIEKIAPEIATINGSISGWNSNCATRNVQITMYNTATATTYIASTTLSTSGSFLVNSVAIPAGNYHILVKVQGALAVLSENVLLTAGANSFSTGPVILGDINNNNVINVLDLSVFSASFLTTAGSPGYNFLADLNCNGVINIFDVSILGAGFNQSGDVLPTD